MRDSCVAVVATFNSHCVICVQAKKDNIVHPRKISLLADLTIHCFL